VDADADADAAGPGATVRAARSAVSSLDAGHEPIAAAAAGDRIRPAGVVTRRAGWKSCLQTSLLDIEE
jgi:hypothetical protein